MVKGENDKQPKINTPQSSSPKDKGGQQDKSSQTSNLRRRFRSVPIAVESEFDTFERVVKRTRSLRWQLEQTPQNPFQQFMEDTDVGEMVMPFVDNGIDVVFEGKKDDDITGSSMSREDAEHLLKSLERFSEELFNQFSAKDYKYPAVTKAARRLYEVKPTKRVMSSRQRAKYADQDNSLINGYEEGWDVDLDPTKPLKNE